MTVYGYARVSTNGQDLALQEEALRGAGCNKILAEKKSGARADRPKLLRLLSVIDEGDVVIVTRLDRLARSSLDLLHTVDRISKAGASFRSIAPILTAMRPSFRRTTGSSCAAKAIHRKARSRRGGWLTARRSASTSSCWSMTTS